MMRKSVASVALAAILSCLASGGSATAHETGPCEGHAYGVHARDVWVVDSLGVISVGGVVYVDDRNAVDGNGVWIYLESNGVSGLQRGGYGPSGAQDVCQESSNPDTLIA